jgi:8-oxo-dGTP pyrophosphatase MutT (NUDIX family)
MQVAQARRVVPNLHIAGAQASAAPRSRQYPDEPRVGVGVVVLREGPDVLLIQRSKEPSGGLWCFPGGSLELGG